VTPEQHISRRCPIAPIAEHAINHVLYLMPASRRRPRRPTISDSPAQTGSDSLEFFLRWLLQDQDRTHPVACPDWPPDLFAVVAYILYQNGEYRRIVQPLSLATVSIGGKEDWREARIVGRSWRHRLDAHIENQDETRSMDEALKSLPILEWWRELISNGSSSISELGDSPRVLTALFRLFFAADEACAGLGMADGDVRTCARDDGLETPPTPAKFFRGQAEKILRLNSNRTLCVYVRPELVSVLPKL